MLIAYYRKEAEPPEARSQAEPGNEGFSFSLSFFRGSETGFLEETRFLRSI
jgi:hypothetical protein